MAWRRAYYGGRFSRAGRAVTQLEEFATDGEAEPLRYEHPNAGQAPDRAPLDEGRGRPRPDLQASAIDTMLRGNPLRDVSRLVDFLAILVVASAALASLSRSRTVGVVAVVAVAVAFFAVTQLAFQAGWIVAVVAPLTRLGAAVLGVAGLVAARKLRPGRERA